MHFIGVGHHKQTPTMTVLDSEGGEVRTAKLLNLRVDIEAFIREVAPVNCPPIIGPVGVIEMACYNWHHQRERQPFKKGADDVFQPGQAVHTAVQISNRLGILKGRKSRRPTRPGVRNASDFHSSLEKRV